MLCGSLSSYFVAIRRPAWSWRHEVSLGDLRIYRSSRGALLSARALTIQGGSEISTSISAMTSAASPWEYVESEEQRRLL